MYVGIKGLGTSKKGLRIVRTYCGFKLFTGFVDSDEKIGEYHRDCPLRSILRSGHDTLKYFRSLKNTSIFKLIIITGPHKGVHLSSRLRGQMSLTLWSTSHPLSLPPPKQIF